MALKAAWVLRLDAKALLAGQTGAWLREHLAQAEPAAKLAAAEVIFGFNPLRDLDLVVAAGASNRPEDAVLVLKGRFDRQRLTTLVRAAEGFTETRHGDDVVLSWTDKGERHHGCFAADDLLVLARAPAPILAVLDVRRGRAAGLPADTFPGFDADPGFLVGAVSDPGRVGGPSAAILQKASSLRLSLAEAGAALTVQATATGADATAADQIEQVVRGLVALVQMKSDLEPAIADVARTASVTRQGTAVRLGVSLPVERLKALVEQARSQKGPLIERLHERRAERAGQE